MQPPASPGGLLGRSRVAPLGLAYAVVLLTPPLAWLILVSQSGPVTSDAAHVAWFTTVGVGCLIAAVLCRGRHAVGLTLVTTAATVVTLFLWWSSEDETGLFAVGLVIATPVVLIVAAGAFFAARTLFSSGVSPRARSDGA